MNARDIEIMERYVESNYGPLKPYRPQKTGYVYFIQSERGGPIKIGWATRPQERLLALQVAHPYQLKLLAAVKGTPKRERTYHARFAASRCPYGEWFEPTDDLLEAISALRSENP